MTSSSSSPPKRTSATDSLMASLMMGNGGHHDNDGDDALFRDVFLTEDEDEGGDHLILPPGPAPSSSVPTDQSPLAPTTSSSQNGTGAGNYNNNNNNNTTSDTRRSSTNATLLESSGLLGLGVVSLDESLFGALDQEEEKEQAAKAREEQERQRRLEQEAAAAKEREQADALQQQLQNTHLGSATMPQPSQYTYASANYSQMQPQQQQQQMHPQQQPQQQQIHPQQMQPQRQHSQIQQQQQMHPQMQQMHPQQSHPQMQQQQPHSQMQPYHVPSQQVSSPPSATPNQVVQAGFYREHMPIASMPSNTSNNSGLQSPLPSNVYGGVRHTNTYQQQNHHQQQHATQSQPSTYSAPFSPNARAGMYNVNPSLGLPPGSSTASAPSASTMHPHSYPSGTSLAPTLPAPNSMTVQPPVVPSIYGKVNVSDPLLIQAPGGLLGLRQSPHWSYQIVTQVLMPNSNTNANHSTNAPQQPQQQSQLWLVRRRFRHIVAMEDRLRQDCPGAILPPRPDKHAGRALEEASTQQSAEFAKQRTYEIEVYLNHLTQHPIAAVSPILRLFLALQDDLGTAWPECSPNAFTRLASVGVGAAMQLSESTAATKFPWDIGGGSNNANPASVMDPNHDYFEDNAELLALQSSESVRMGAVMQGVPKLEGAVTLLKEHAELKGGVGMEIGRLAKDCSADDHRDIGQPLELLSLNMLRDGRRSKRATMELGSALYCFTQHYRLCRYERMAFADRRAALIRRSKERGKADQRAAQLYLQQRQQQQLYSQQPHAYGGNLDRLEREAVVLDEWAIDAVRECDEIGQRLKSEINRVSFQRRSEWHAAVKVMASAMKEACNERTQIWEQAREAFLQAFPEEGQE